MGIGQVQGGTRVPPEHAAGGGIEGWYSDCLWAQGRFSGGNGGGFLEAGGRMLYWMVAGSVDWNR